MTLVLLVCSSLVGLERLVEAQRLAEADRIIQAFKERQGIDNLPRKFLSDFDVVRLDRLYSIAMTRRLYLEYIDLCERLHEVFSSPEAKLKCQTRIEDTRQKLYELDKRERLVRGDGPPLPLITLPPRP
jgi:hypothetical protein